jgi:hypothetical protein
MSSRFPPNPPDSPKRRYMDDLPAHQRCAQRSLASATFPAAILAPGRSTAIGHEKSWNHRPYVQLIRLPALEQLCAGKACDHRPNRKCAVWPHTLATSASSMTPRDFFNQYVVPAQNAFEAEPGAQVHAVTALTQVDVLAEQVWPLAGKPHGSHRRYRDELRNRCVELGYAWDVHDIHGDQRDELASSHVEHRHSRGA